MANPTWSEILDGLKQDIRNDSEALLERLKQAGSEVRGYALQLADLGAEVAVKKLGGIDTSVEEGAMKAVFLNLATAASLELAREVRDAIRTAIFRALKAVIAILASIG